MAYDKKNMRGQVHNSMYHQVQERGYAAPIDVLMDLEVLSKSDHESWRFGKVPYLEKVCKTNLKELSRIMHEVRAYAAKNELKASWTCYHQWGKNKERRLRFSKSGDEGIEKQYATHYVDKCLKG